MAIPREEEPQEQKQLVSSEQLLPSPDTLLFVTQTLFPQASEQDLPQYVERVISLLRGGVSITDLVALKQTEQAEHQLILQADQLALEKQRVKIEMTQAEAARASAALEKLKFEKQEARRAEKRVIAIRQQLFEVQIASWTRSDIEEANSRYARAENIFALVTSARNLQQQIRIVDWLDRVLLTASPTSSVDYRRQEAEDPHSVWSIVTRQMGIPAEIKSWEGVRQYLQEKSRES